MSMFGTLGAEWFGVLLGLALVISGALIYIRGWLRLRRMAEPLASRKRLLALGLGVVAICLGLIWPMPDWSYSFLAARSVQKVLLCMLAPPLLLLGCAFPIGLWGLPGQLRRAFVHQLKPDSYLYGSMRIVTQPGICWLAYVGAFILWHDPVVAQWTLTNEVAHWLVPGLLFMAAWLFWLPIIPTGPRLHKPLPGWVIIIYLVAVEIPNMVAGVTMAFTDHPIYPFYEMLRTGTRAAGISWPLSVMEDQMIAGAIIWVTGSIVYISSIMVVLNRLFAHDGSTGPQPAQNWDSYENLIAPGLEHRATENRLQDVDLGHR